MSFYRWFKKKSHYSKLNKRIQTKNIDINIQYKKKHDAQREKLKLKQ